MSESSMSKFERQYKRIRIDSQGRPAVKEKKKKGERVLTVSQSVSWVNLCCTYIQEVDNMSLRRFLRARDQDVGKASAMLLKFVSWRRELALPGGGTMPAEQVRVELSQDKARMGGVDRAGRPVLLAFPANHYSANRDMAEHKRTHARHIPYAYTTTRI